MKPGEGVKPQDTLIDNLIKRKKARYKAAKRARSKDRFELIGLRDKILNRTVDLAGKSPLMKRLIKKDLDARDYPEHLAVIPDGNRRWAEARDLSLYEGYFYGSKRIKDIREWAMIDNDVKVLTFYTLSIDNIQGRSSEQLNTLFNMVKATYNQIPQDEVVHKNEIRYEIRGNQSVLDKLPDGVKEVFDEVENATAEYDKHRIIFLIGYGGRTEVEKAAHQLNNSLVNQDKEQPRDSVKQQFRENLELGDVQDVDLTIRTSETRISNFMMYHVANSDFVFSEKMWPAFTEDDFYQAMYLYNKRGKELGV